MVILNKQKRNSQVKHRKELSLLRWLFFFIPFLFHTNLTAQKQPLSSPFALSSEHFQNALHAIFTLDNDSSQHLISLLNQVPQTKHQAAYLKQYNLFVNYITTENDTILNKYLNSFEETIAFIEKSNTSQNNYFKTDLYLHKGIVDFSMNNQWQALNSFIKAYTSYSAIDTTLQIPYLKHQAIFNILLGNLTGYYEKMAYLFGYEGDLNLGFNQFQDYTKQTIKKKGFQIEALTYEAWCKLKFDQIKPDIIIQTKSQSPLFKFVSTSLLLKSHNGDLAYNTTCEWSDTLMDYFPLLYYIKGKTVLPYNPQLAENLFNEFSNKYHGENHKIDAIRYIAWIKILQEDTLAYHKIKVKLLQNKATGTFIDKQAYKEITKNPTPHKELLQSRIQFDFGNYVKADSILNSIDLDVYGNNRLKAEFYYRKARILQQSEMNSEAINNYKKAILYSKHDNRYFGPYSAIYIAKIATTNNDTTMAIKFYNRALELNTGEYQTDIKRKAHMGLNILTK